MHGPEPLGPERLEMEVDDSYSESSEQIIAPLVESCEWPTHSSRVPVPSPFVGR